MVDAVAATTRSAPLQADELRQQARMVEQIDAYRVDDREQDSLQVGLGPRREIVCDPMLAKAFAWPLTTITIADDAQTTISFERTGKLTDNALRREWRLDLAQHIDHRHLALLVTNRQ